MHPQLGLELAFSLSGRSAHDKSSVLAFDPSRPSLKFNFDPKLARLTHQAVNQIEIKLFKWTLGAVQNRDFGSSTSGQVGKLKRYVTAADEYDSAGQGIKFKKLIAGSEVVFARNVQRLGFGPHSNQNVSAFQCV